MFLRATGHGRKTPVDTTSLIATGLFELCARPASGRLCVCVRVVGSVVVNPALTSSALKIHVARVLLSFYFLFGDNLHLETIRYALFNALRRLWCVLINMCYQLLSYSSLHPMSICVRQSACNTGVSEVSSVLLAQTMECVVNTFSEHRMMKSSVNEPTFAEKFRAGKFWNIVSKSWNVALRTVHYMFYWGQTVIGLAFCLLASSES